MSENSCMRYINNSVMNLSAHRFMTERVALILYQPIRGNVDVLKQQAPPNLEQLRIWWFGQIVVGRLTEELWIQQVGMTHSFF